MAENDLLDETVVIRAKPLTPEEAIGNPESEDFPILKGVERLMQAEFAGSFGQAFTDMYGDFEGTLQDVLAMELTNNYRRAIFVATPKCGDVAPWDDRGKCSLQGQRSD